MKKSILQIDMKFLVVSVLVLGAVAEPPAPYPPSGWRPSGPAFELPQQNQQPQQYLPPVDPRTPRLNPTPQYPEEDVSVQGLPAPGQEQLQFQPSPVSGQQYAGPGFDNDVRTLDQRLQQAQYEQQQQRYKEYQRQKQLEAAQAQNNANRLPSPQSPRQFGRTTSTTEAPTTDVSTTTELDLNQGEVLNAPASAKLRKGSVEVTKQNIQEYPGELFLNGLAQIQLQPQLVPLQVSGAYVQPQSQKQVQGFDAATHFSALPSVLAQQNQLPQGYQNPVLLQNEPDLVQQPVPQYQTYQPQIQTPYQPDSVVVQGPSQFAPSIYGQPNPDAVAAQPNLLQGSFQPQAFPQFQQANPDAVSFNQQQAQFQPQPQGSFPQFQQANPDAVSFNQQQAQFQPQLQGSFPQFQQANPDAVSFNQQQAQFQPQQGSVPQFQQANPDAVSINQPTFQPQGFQPQQGSFPQFQAQPVLIPRPLTRQPENTDQQYQQPIIVQQYPQVQPQNQYLQPEIQYLGPQEVQRSRGQSQGQETLQSGLDIDQDGNDIEEDQNPEADADRATSVATAFGTRTQPRVNPRYGAPFPVPRVQANPGYSATTESNVEEVTEEGPAVAQATAAADGERRKSARLRNRRIRPVIAVDRSGHLVLAEA